MPLERYEAGVPVFDARTLNHIRFGMVDADAGDAPVAAGSSQTGKLIRCSIEIDALRDLIGEPETSPIEAFISYQDVVEEAASEKYDREGAPDGTLDLDDTDFT